MRPRKSLVLMCGTSLLISHEKVGMDVDGWMEGVSEGRVLMVNTVRHREFGE